MTTDLTTTKKLNRKGWKVLFLALLAIIGTIVAQVIGYIVALGLHIPENSLAFTTVVQMLSAGSAALAMVVLGGAAWLRPSKKDVREMFRIGWPIIAVSAAILLFAGVSFVVEGSSVASDWLSNLAITAVICLGIGVAEEVMYRGVLLNAVLAVTGRSHRGTMVGVVIISILFGFAHVSVITDFADPLLATQAILKIIQTGLFSILMCSVVLRTHRLGGAALFHGLSDFLIMIPTLVMAGEQLTTNYVSAGDEGVTTIVAYLVIIAFYLPLAIKAWRRMHHEQVTYRGAFMEHASTHKDAVLPAPPMDQPTAA